MNWFTKLSFGSLAVGAPSLVAFGGFIDWKEGVTEKIKGLDLWLTKAWENGGGTNTSENVAKLKEKFNQDSSNWEHPGLFVETVGDYVKRILNKDGVFGSGNEKTKFEVQGIKKTIDKVGFKYDQKTGGLGLSLGVSTENDLTKRYLDNSENLCILSVTEKNIEGKEKIGKLDLLVGFYKGNWKGGETIQVKGSEGLITGYGDWCKRRAKTFDKEQNLVIGIPFNSKIKDSLQVLKVSGGKASEIIYILEDRAVSFIGKDLGKNNGYSRVCGTKPNDRDCAGNVWPVVLGVIGNKNAGTNKFEDSSPTEAFSEIHFGSKTWDTKSQVTCSTIKTCNIGTPVGVKFNNVKITGKSLSDWSINP